MSILFMVFFRNKNLNVHNVNVLSVFVFQRPDAISPQIGSKLFPGLSPVSSARGFPLDMAGAAFHPAFQQQLLMGGLGLPGVGGALTGVGAGGGFPTPLQVHQMISVSLASFMLFFMCS